jgi:hypothetical protein
MSKNREKVLKSALSRALPKSQPGEPDGSNTSVTIGLKRAPKLSVSLYQRDLHRLDEIKEFMQKRGIRNVSDSEALRLAIRGMELGEGLVDVYREMLGEDGRRKAS